MKNPAKRAVLAFYSNEEQEQAKRVYQSLRASGIDARMSSSDAGSLPESCRLYEQLTIPGESLVAVEAEPSKIGRVVETLRLAGSPSIFVIHPEFLGSNETKPAPRIPAQTRREILLRLDAEKKALDSARRDLREAMRLDHALPSAADWILDNSYLIRAQIAEVRRHLPRDFKVRKSAPGS